MLTGGFIGLPLLVAAGFVALHAVAARRLGEPPRTMRLASLVIAWLALTWMAAASGVLRRFDLRPPPFGLLVLSVIVVSVVIAWSPVGTRLVRGLPLAILVGTQVFRLPLELLMHRAYVEGVMPVQMSYSGLNWDILTGITAGVLGLWLIRRRAPGWVVAVWNILGFALLVNIVAVAILSTPAFRRF